MKRFNKGTEARRQARRKAAKPQPTRVIPDKRRKAKHANLELQQWKKFGD